MRKIRRKFTYQSFIPWIEPTEGRLPFWLTGRRVGPWVFLRVEIGKTPVLLNPLPSYGEAVYRYENAPRDPRAVFLPARLEPDVVNTKMNVTESRIVDWIRAMISAGDGSLKPLAESARPAEAPTEIIRRLMNIPIADGRKLGDIVGEIIASPNARATSRLRRELCPYGVNVLSNGHLAIAHNHPEIMQSLGLGYGYHRTLTAHPGVVDGSKTVWMFDKARRCTILQWARTGALPPAR